MISFVIPTHYEEPPSRQATAIRVPSPVGSALNEDIFYWPRHTAWAETQGNRRRQRRCDQERHHFGLPQPPLLVMNAWPPSDCTTRNPSAQGFGKRRNEYMLQHNFFSSQLGSYHVKLFRISVARSFTKTHGRKLASRKGGSGREQATRNGDQPGPLLVL